MDIITAFGIGALAFVLIVLLTAFYLKSALILVPDNKRSYIIETQEDVADVMDDMPDNIENDMADDKNDPDAPETVPGKS
ncbi:MAG TPA: hypothetical protein C5S50_04430 [Methanosarcinaceae archaeon]|nr:hypothetical protein [Methanosarcinaceae archaeon]